ncbi:single-stranded DNA-binding protein [Candidatus Uhrbacteria bacterium]|nr:single-stranded DNA-binding protein [Candidatus Uhrbacteria bacterium]MBI4812265.1 single-stranded DNA-binding protein [Candidatus Falkowbacteria bacterium]
MFSLNRAAILGNLTRDPEMRQIPSGQKVCTLGVATNRQWNDPAGQKQEATEFHNVVAWGRLAEICGQYLTKGKKVYIEGRLQTREWEGQDGIKRYRTEIVAENLIMLDRAGASAAGASGASAFQNKTTSAFVPPEPKTIQNDPSENRDDEIRVEDIPF